MTAAVGLAQIEAVLAVGLDGRLVYVNRHVELLTGRSRSDLLGMPLSWLFPEDGDQPGQGVCSLAARAMEESRRLGPGIDWVRSADNAVQPVAECYVAPICNRYGLTSGAMIVVRGINERVALRA